MEESTREEPRPRRFFVRIFATDARQLREVMTLDLDLFAARSDQSGHRVDGLIAIEDVARLVESGYRVLVGDTDRPTRRPEFVGFDEWREGMLADLEQQEEQG